MYVSEVIGNTLANFFYVSKGGNSDKFSEGAENIVKLLMNSSEGFDKFFKWHIFVNVNDLPKGIGKPI